jgi:hypothetical protein
MRHPKPITSLLLAEWCLLLYVQITNRLETQQSQNVRSRMGTFPSKGSIRDPTVNQCKVLIRPDPYKVRSTSIRLLNHTGAPDFVWIWAYRYLALVNSGIADRTLRWKCPHTKRFGATPDILALLSFQPICYLDVEEQTPFSKEKAGYWLGVAHNVGDALTSHNPLRTIRRQSSRGA